jgi:hypothetical protein
VRHGCVYGLRDPETNELRYVGKTVHRPSARLNGHMLGAMNGSSMRVAHWIRTLGTEPRLTIFACDVPEHDLAETEAAVIHAMRSAGYDLLNRPEVSRA